MATEAEHIQQAVHNMRVAAYLRNESQFRDWTATALFYSAVHIVEAVFFIDLGNQHGHTHDIREGLLKQNKYLNIARYYIPLKKISLTARYLIGMKTGTTFAEYISEENITNIFINHHLTQVIKTATKFLSPKSADTLNTAFRDIF